MPRESKTRPRSVNEVLLDRTIRHAVYLVRLGGGEAAWLNEQIPSLRRTLMEAISPIITRLEGDRAITLHDKALIEQASIAAERVAREFFQEIATEHTERMYQLALQEADFELRLFQNAIPVEWNFATPSDAFIRSVIETSPISGKTARQWFSGLPDDVRLAVNNQIQEAMLEGESIDGIVKRIRGTRASGYTDGIMETTRAHAETLVRTGVMKASNVARQAFHDANSDVIKSYSVVATLDTRTCVQCAFMESQNPYRKDDPPQAPFHPNCRCVVVANTLSWEELGIDLEEMEPGTRASMDGEVPEDMTYQQWFDQQSAARQKDILGPSRYEAYKKGMEVTAFADRGKILTLDELRAMEPDLFPA